MTVMAQDICHQSRYGKIHPFIHCTQNDPNTRLFSAKKKW